MGGWRRTELSLEEEGKSEEAVGGTMEGKVNERKGSRSRGSMQTATKRRRIVEKYGQVGLRSEQRRREEESSR